MSRGIIRGKGGEKAVRGYYKKEGKGLRGNVRKTGWVIKRKI